MPRKAAPPTPKPAPRTARPRGPQAVPAVPPVAVTDPPDGMPVRRDVAARWLAIGTTQKRAADEAGVDVRTVAQWCTEQPFRDRIADLRATAFTELEADMLANVRHAIDLERRVFTEELKHDNPAYREAKPLLERVRNLIFRIEAPPAQGGDAQGSPGVAVYVANGGVQHERPGGTVIDSTARDPDRPA